MKFHSKMDEVGKNSPRVTCAKRVKSIVQSVFTGVVCCQVPKFDNKKGGEGQCEGSPGKGDESDREKEDRKEVQDHLCEVHQNKGTDALGQIKHCGLMIVDQQQFHDHPHPSLLDQSSKPPLQNNQHHHHVHLNSPQHFQCPEDTASAKQCHHVHVFRSKAPPHPSPEAPVEALLVQENRDSTFPSHLVPAPVLQCQEHRVDGAQCQPGTLHGKSTQCSYRKDQDCLAEIEKHIDRVASEYRHFQILAHQAQQNQNPHNMHPQTIVHYQCNKPSIAPEPCSKTDSSPPDIEKQLDRLANEFRLYKQCLIRHTPSSRQGDKIPRGGYIATLSLRYGEEELSEAEALKQELESGKDSQHSNRCMLEKWITTCGPCLHVSSQAKLDHQGIMNHQTSAAQEQCKDTQAHVVLTSPNSIPCEPSTEEGMKNDPSINNQHHNLFENYLNKLAREYKHYQQMICHRVTHQDNAANSFQENKDRYKDQQVQPEQPTDVQVSKQAYKPEVKVNTSNVPEINRYLDDLAREYQHCKILVNQYKGFEPTLPDSDNLTVASCTNIESNGKVAQKDNEKPKGVAKDPSKRFDPQVPDTNQKATDKEGNCTPGSGEPVNAKIPGNGKCKSEKKMEISNKANDKSTIKSVVSPVVSPNSSKSKKEIEQKSDESNKTKGKCDHKSSVKPVVAAAACLNSTYKEENEQIPNMKVKCGNVESNRNDDACSTRKHCRKHHFEDPANFESKSTVRICSLS